MKTQLQDAVDAFSASAATRLRYIFLAAKERGQPSAVPILPPPVEIPSQRQHPFYDGTECAYHDRHPLAHLMRLRDEAAAEVERLLTFLDETDGIEDVELNGDEHEPNLAGDSLAQPWTDECEGDCCEDEGAQCDDEGDRSDSGVGDIDGLMEQCPERFAHCDVRVDV